jgi:hypothetical protein
MYAPPRATWPAAAHASNGGRARRRPSAVGAHGRGHPWPRGAYVRGCPPLCAPHGRARPRPTAPCAPTRPTAPCAPTCPTAHAPHAPHGRSHPMTARAPRAPTFAPPVRAPKAFVPLLRTPRDVRAHGSHSRPIACAPLEYKFIKIVVHSTTWASRPSTTVRWMTAGCLGGDHSFLIHFHGPRAHPRTRLYACLI